MVGWSGPWCQDQAGAQPDAASGRRGVSWPMGAPQEAVQVEAGVSYSLGEDVTDVRQGHVARVVCGRTRGRRLAFRYKFN